ncbi:serine carboxypeptidase-like 20 isoform X2 [Hevea brasiliensis]|uniref:serine carboxypeptidase-like 20 isoform X2 n=1 Tax=Hevea brasiliensis TaxID=3981 RepID=UPI0025E3B6CC|nr:serine carboxypeptidase-like 20 isoform X2 [Hevea brasiliensis]
MDKIFFLRILICMLLNFVSIQGAPENARVTSLPGFSGIFPSNHYSGYVNLPVTSNTSKNLFYYFVESERDAKRDPVVLWLNGGPGCSSFDGFIYEHGPFDFKAAKEPGKLPTLNLNPYSWSKVSSVIYLDSPAGVGFSYSDNTSFYQTGDKRTASDTHHFLIKWFKLFPEFLSNPFYISGESFAGVYVPTLADEIVKGIEARIKPVINLKGYLIGNAVTDKVFDGNALVPFAHGMGLISDDIYKEVVAGCKGNYYDPETDECSNLIDLVNNEIDGLNIYNILEPCYHTPTEHGNISIPKSFKQLGRSTRSLPVRKRIFGRAWPFRAPVIDGLVLSWPQIIGSMTTSIDSMTSLVPCVNDGVANEWLNNEDVRKAIHAASGAEIGNWELCSDKLSYWHDAGSMIKFHRNLTSQGYRVLVYSGDHDMCVPYTGSQAWTRSLGYEIVDKWRPWITSDEQVAGYVQAYDKNLTFLTVKGAGHTVPEYKPAEALEFYRRWLDGLAI